MSWIYGYFGTKTQDCPDLRCSRYKFDTAILKLRAGGGRNLVCIQNPDNADEQVFIFGDPILRKGEDFSYPAPSDWVWLFEDEERIRQLDGHWLIVIANPGGIRAYNDPLGKRSFFIHPWLDGYFFCSEISLLKESGLATLDPYRFGAYWHSMFPPHLRRYAPTKHSYYENVKMLFQGGKLTLSAMGLHIEQRAFVPIEDPLNLPKILENLTLLPLRAGRKVCVGISGGMDIRPLLAILLKSRLPFSTVHFGSMVGEDYRIAFQIARDHHLPFRYISHQEASGGWQMACDYLHGRGFGFNPASHSLMGYYPILAEEADVFMGGYYGELFRFRFMSAHIASLFKPGKPDFGSFAGYLNNHPQSFFIPEINKEMHRGFIDALKKALQQMPPPGSMPNPLWMNLFYVRYSPRSINMPDLTQLDQYLCDHMPYLQCAPIQQHWQYGLWRQLRENLHRGIIRSQAPDLQNYPLAIAEYSAPYRYRPYALKIRLLMKRKRARTFTVSRTEQFLKDYRNQIQDLRRDSRVIEDPWLNLKMVDEILSAYYGGDLSRQNAVLSFLTYVLAK